MARLFADENFPRPVVEHLRALGHDVLTTDKAGLAGRGVSDHDILQYATNDGRCVLTINRRDFVRLHDAVPNHAGIVVCTFNPMFQEQAHAISSALSLHQEFHGRLIRVNRPGPTSATPG